MSLAYSRGLPQEFLECLDNEAIGFLGADAHAQSIRQLVGADLAQDKAAFREESIRVLSGTPLGIGEVDEHEIRRAWRSGKPELADLVRKPREPLRVVCARAFHVRG